MGENVSRDTFRPSSDFGPGSISRHINAKLSLNPDSGISADIPDAPGAGSPRAPRTVDHVAQSLPEERRRKRRLVQAAAFSGALSLRLCIAYALVVAMANVRRHLKAGGSLGVGNGAPLVEALCSHETEPAANLRAAPIRSASSCGRPGRRPAGRQSRPGCEAAIRPAHPAPVRSAAPCSPQGLSSIGSTPPTSNEYAVRWNLPR